MKKVLVTGGKGLLGYALKQVVSQQNDANVEFVFVDIEDANLCDFAQVKNLFSRVEPTGVIHLAADVGGLYKNLAHGVEMFENNLLMNMHVMQCSKIFGVEKLISCLSTCTFPEPSLSKHISLPIDETMIHLGPPHPSNESYAYAKRMVDVQSRYYRKQYGCNFVTLAPTNIFGPNDNYAYQSSHVIPSLIRKCYEAVENHTDFIVLGTGKPLRQFVYSLDLAKLFLWAFFYYDEENPLILSPSASEEVSIGEVAQLIANAFGYKKQLVFDHAYSDGQFQRTVSNAKLRQLNSSFKFTPIGEAIAYSVEWYKSNLSVARL